VLFFQCRAPAPSLILPPHRHLDTSILLDSVAELGVRAICILVAFAFTPACKSEARNTGSTGNHSGLESAGGGICGPSLIRKLRFGIQFQSPRFYALSSYRHRPWHWHGLRHFPQHQRYRWFRRMGTGRMSATCLTVAYNQLVFGNDEIRLRVLARAAESELVGKCIK
jgi:hypothetical protein